MRKQSKKTNKAKATFLGFGVLGLIAVGYMSVSTDAQWDVVSTSESSTIEQKNTEQTDDTNTFVRDPNITYIKTPEPMYAIYMSQCVVGTPSFREKLVSLIESTALNAVVIDVKDYTGTLAFRTGDPQFQDAELVACGAGDMKAFLASLKEKGIYTIARITVFQDPFYTKKYPEQAAQSISRPGEPWKDNKGLAFVDVSSRDFWKYIADLAKHTHAIGFDELNFDYVRYPSDGPMSDAQYVDPNKPEALEKFFKYLYSEIHPTGAVLSVDLFGYVTVLEDDLGIGQQLERALPYFDYIAPMVYPSHYNKGFAGLNNPNNDPHKVVYTSMKRAVERAVATQTRVRTLDGEPILKEETVSARYSDSGELLTATTTRMVPTGFYTKEVYDVRKLRPWLQDFDYGKEYTPQDIERQIQATYDAGLTSWYFWDPANRYDSLSSYLRGNF
ncbi:hypothetical protein COU15_01375 [Candidatus Kaiserbacteria bacterium CG10_big_fil_rev_8_21_14_0_10_45_20]|uniref:DUF4015 domain-containing protein n=1 Tax=Candidatus Kaiserbacteria bacterium CG10_big_fil_rev_8_21_14_0_10_45_20 TaxID=1974607 RepID=A0A2H0UFU9_9BACT|nr:MAG: hypothetical protein COU15_01375 [Candidatus Kaiserbacteria bacterium CG10_big_fil_rev_8_21_14_0_10_45_20]